jgi:hypothetical protein
MAFSLREKVPREFDKPERESYKGEGICRPVAASSWFGGVFSLRKSELQREEIAKMGGEKRIFAFLSLEPAMRLSNASPIRPSIQSKAG